MKVDDVWLEPFDPGYSSVRQEQFAQKIEGLDTVVEARFLSFREDVNYAVWFSFRYPEALHLESVRIRSNHTLAVEQKVAIEGYSVLGQN